MNQAPGYDVPTKKVVSRKYFRIFLAILLVTLVATSYAFIKGNNTRKNAEDLITSANDSTEVTKG
jgi:CHASE3 domain sensor protein